MLLSDKSRGLCQSKVSCNLAAVQRPGHREDNCKMVYYVSDPPLANLYILLLLQALVAVLPKAQMQYFDVETKIWKAMSPSAPLNNVTCCCYAESVGVLFLGGKDSDGDCIFCYDIENNFWERQPHNLGRVERMCALNDFMYAITSVHRNQLPQRYNFSKRQWQTFTKVSITADSKNYFYNSGVAVLGAKVYVLYGKRITPDPCFAFFSVQTAELHCFDPAKNEWKGKATTCQPHFGSSLIVVNNRLYVAGGNVNINDRSVPLGNRATVEVYDEKKNTWSVVQQKHIPPNHLNAVEIEGRVYFIINKFPVDSGIRIPPGELYPVHLGDWGNLAKIATTAVLSYLPVKRESLKKD